MTLDQKEKLAYVGALLLEGLIALAFLLASINELAGASGNPPPSGGEKQSKPEQNSETVTVELVNVDNIQPKKGSDGSLASEQKGKGLAAEDQKSAVKAEAKNTKTTQTGTTQSSLESNTKAEESKTQSEKVLSKGEIPPIKYLGDLNALFEEFPRIEVAWLHVEQPVPGQELPPVVWQIVMNQEGQIGAENCSTKTRLGDFSSITMRHRSEERILAQSKTQMALWKRKNEFSSLTGTQMDENKITWGHYRHRGEVALLDSVSALYRNAVINGTLQSGSNIDGFLEVTLQKQNAKMVISSVFYVPKSNGDVKKKL